MFIGHVAVGFAAKRAVPKVPLGTLVFAALWLDLLWPFLLLAGIERVAVEPGFTAFSPLRFLHYPYSHSLLAAVFWASLFGAVYRMVSRDRKTGIALALLVLSHWGLDLVAHRPDLPLLPGGDRFYGMGLWDSFGMSVAVEGGLYLAGVAVYSASTSGRDRKGTLAFWSLALFLPLVWTAGFLAPPPPGEAAVAFGSLAAWLFIPWASWADRHRIVLTR